ncbi:MAG: hypothetical protein U1E46_17635 [Hyphomicrobiales bacterium]
MGLRALLVAVPMLVLASGQPHAQLAAINNQCAQDFAANCGKTKPDSMDALRCLERNADRLTSSCSSAVHVARADYKQMRAACTDDFLKLCPHTPARGDKALKCLSDNAAQLSSPCSKALKHIRS